MDIIETKNKLAYNDDVKKLMTTFRFNKEIIDVKGSYSMAGIKYYGDYDFITNIKRRYGVKDIYNEFHKILNLILKNVDMYFVEFKIQNLNKKYRFYPNDNFKSNIFEKEFNEDKTDFCKIDIVYFNQNQFIESSCIYNFSDKHLSKEQYIKDLNNDIKELKKEGKYYKMMKRLYSIYKIKGEDVGLQKLTDIFNSNLGLTYKNISNIEAIELVKKYYDKEPLTRHRIEVNLKNIGYPLNYKLEYRKQSKLLNDEAKKLYNQII